MTKKSFGAKSFYPPEKVTMVLSFSLCIKHVFYYDGLTLRDLPRLANFQEHTFYMKTDQAKHQTLPLLSSLSGHCPPTLITSEPVARQQRLVSMSQSLLKLFKLASHFLLCLTLSSHRNHISPHCGFVTDPDMALKGMVWPVPSSWEQWVTSYLFNGNCLLICWPHHTWTLIKPTF